MYFVVRRAFRDKQGPVPVGSIVEPAGIKNFKYRLAERHIVQVTEQNFEQYAHLFQIRFGITLPACVEEAQDATETPALVIAAQTSLSQAEESADKKPEPEETSAQQAVEPEETSAQQIIQPEETSAKKEVPIVRIIAQ